MLVFPEGTFRRTPGLLPFRLGAFKAAVESGRPVVPIAIHGTRELLPPGAWIPRRHDVRVTVGAPIPPAGGGWPEMVRLRDLTRTAIAGSMNFSGAYMPTRREMMDRFARPPRDGDGRRCAKVTTS